MSTKNLSRTVIEGGRGNVYERRKTSKDLRAAERAYLSKVKLDWENWEEEFEPEQDWAGKDFSDKLNPMYRWLDAQVGRPWAEVRSEVFAKFDTRTTAGRHITFDHLLRSVIDTESGFDKHGRMANPNIEIIRGDSRRYYYYRHEYYVDEKGILQTYEPTAKSYWRRPYATEAELREVEKWLDASIIGEKEGKLYWFCATEGCWKASWEKDAYGYSHSLGYYLWDKGEYKVNKTVKYSFGTYTHTEKHHGPHWEEIKVPFSYRQRGPLTEKDIKYFNSLNERVREQILAFGKGR
jgi:hypothetical protein